MPLPAKSRISLAELRRLERALQRASALWDADDLPPNGGDAVECIRNAETALAHLGGWIEYRARHRKDPGEGE